MHVACVCVAFAHCCLWLLCCCAASAGEPCFVPRPGATAEDDGVVLSLVARGDGGAFLLALDGRTFQEVGRAVLPFAVPYRFHGTFVPSAAPST